MPSRIAAKRSLLGSTGGAGVVPFTGAGAALSSFWTPPLLEPELSDSANMPLDKPPLTIAGAAVTPLGGGRGGGGGGGATATPAPTAESIAASGAGGGGGSSMLSAPLSTLAWCTGGGGASTAQGTIGPPASGGGGGGGRVSLWLAVRWRLAPLDGVPPVMLGEEVPLETEPAVGGAGGGWLGRGLRDGVPFPLAGEGAGCCST